MNFQTALETIQHALENPVPTWGGYSPQHVPLVLYNDEAFHFLNHPGWMATA